MNEDIEKVDYLVRELEVLRDKFWTRFGFHGGIVNQINVVLSELSKLRKGIEWYTRHDERP